MDRRLKRVLSLQLALLLIAVLGAYAVWGLGEARAVWFGSFIAVANTLLIVWRMRRSRNKDRARGELGAQQYLKQFYRSWLERYLVVGALLAMGLGGLKLMPLGLLAGFILGQVIWIFAPLTIKET